MFPPFLGKRNVSCTGETVLRGVILDQDQLHAVLAQIEGFGLELLEVRRVEPPPRGA